MWPMSDSLTFLAAVAMMVALAVIVAWPWTAYSASTR